MNIAIQKKHRYLPVLLFFLVSCSSSPRLHDFSGQTMGTFYKVRVVLDKPGNPEQLESGIQAALESVNQAMSNWIEDSDISRFNRADINEPVSVSQETLKVVEQAMRVANQTEGAFDPTLSPLIELWGFGKAQRDGFPEESQIQDRLARFGIEKINVQTNQLSKSQAGVTLNLSAIAKGFGVDQVAHYLREQGVTRFMVEVGGEIQTAGLNHLGRAWRIGIENPLQTGPSALFAIASLQDAAMATSGDYRNHFEHEGVVYSHILDPRTGYPIKRGIASVTVIAPSCMQADALATAFMVTGKEAGMRLTESIKNVECLFLEYDDEAGLKASQSSGMSAYLQRLEERQTSETGINQPSM